MASKNKLLEKHLFSVFAKLEFDLALKQLLTRKNSSHFFTVKKIKLRALGMLEVSKRLLLLK